MILSYITYHYNSLYIIYHISYMAYIIYHISYIVIVMRSVDCPSTTRLIIRRTGVGFQCILLMTLAHLFIFERPLDHHLVWFQSILHSAIARSPWKPPKRLAVSTPSMPRVGRRCHVHCPLRVQGTHGNIGTMYTELAKNECLLNCPCDMSIHI